LKFTSKGDLFSISLEVRALAVVASLRRAARSDFLRNSAIVFAAQAVVNLMNFVFHALMSRRLGPSGYGALNALIAGSIIFSVPAVIMTTVLVKYAAEFHATGSIARLRTLSVRAAQVFGTAALVVAVTGTLLAPAIARYLHIGGTIPVVVTAVMLAFSLFLPIRGLLQGVEDFRAFSVSCTSEAVLKVVFAALFTAFGWGVAGALGGWLAGLAASATYTYGTVWLRYRTYAPEALRIDYRRLLRTTLGVALATLCITLLGFSDVILVKHFFDPQAAGVYAALSLCGKMLFFLVSFVPAVLLPRAAALSSSGRPTLGTLGVGLATVCVLAGAGLLIFFRYPVFIVHLLTGDAFLAAAPLLFPYGIATSLLGCIYAVVSYNIGVHRFAFVAPLIVIAVGEIAGISFFHSSSLQVIYVLIACNVAAMVAALSVIPYKRDRSLRAGAPA
jgi:O-antigen/teichoic acid export membrane protein